MADRLAQVAGHLSGAHPRGLLAGEVAIVTGAAQGIGRSVALLFAKEGAKVVVTDLDEKKAQVVVDELSPRAATLSLLAAMSPPMTSLKRSSTPPSSMYCASSTALAVLAAQKARSLNLDADGGSASICRKFGKINHIVNNAGFTYDRMLHTTPDDAWDIIIRVHVRAPFRLVRAAAPHMRIKCLLQGNTENRSVINVSSTSGLHGNVGQANYAAAKAAVIGFTKTVCKEWGPFGVRANTIAFGFVQTRLTAAKEAGASIEIDGKKVALGYPSGASREGPEPIRGHPPRSGSDARRGGGRRLVVSAFSPQSVSALD
uniref:Bromo domain-containing protein n=1 Tax=Ganoderma boninense TaxID=34458 RepID=A0A5K1K8N2_9APHY|nr:Bromo domain-containing protein [Ganoderma boninense]